MSIAQAVSFLSDFKLGHYMKIPPRSMFLVQVNTSLLAPPSFSTFKKKTHFFTTINLTTEINVSQNINL